MSISAESIIAEKEAQHWSYKATICHYLSENSEHLDA